MKLTTTQLMIGAVGVAVAGYLYMQNKKKKEALMGGGQTPEQKTEEASPSGGGGGGFGGGGTTAPIPAVVVATPSVTPPKAPEEKKPEKAPMQIQPKPPVSSSGKPTTIPNTMPSKNFVDTDTEFMSFTHLDFDGGFDY
jgi:hypothetical protein